MPSSSGARRAATSRRRSGTSAPWPRWGSPTTRPQWRRVATLSGGEQKRLVLEALLRGPDEVLLLDEPDNYLDVPTKRWLEDALIATRPRPCCSSATTGSCSTAWRPGSPRSSPAPQVHAVGAPGAVSRRTPSRRRPELAARGAAPALGRGAREAQGAGADVQAEGRLQRRAGRRATRPPQTRLAKFVEAGPPEGAAQQHVKMRLTGGRTGKRAVVAEELELTGLMRPFDLEVWYGERVAVLGSNGSGKSHFLRLLAAGGSDPERSTGRSATCTAPVAHTGSCVSAPGCVPAGSPRPTSTPRSSGGPCSRSSIAATTTATGKPRRRPRARSTATSWRGRGSSVSSRSPAASRRGSRSSCSSSPGRPCCCSTSRRTTSTSSPPRRSRRGSRRFEGTVVAVTHDRWFARGFDRFLVFGADGRVYESSEPVWDEGRVVRPR